MVEVREDLNKRIQQHLDNKLMNGEIEILTDKTPNLEEKYNMYYSEYKKKLKKLIRSARKYIMRPYDFLEEFEFLIQEMRFVGIIDEEYEEYQRERLHREIEAPNEFKAEVEKAKALLKEKARRYKEK